MKLQASNLAFYSTFDLVNATHEIYMKRCFELALKGKFSAAPNPRVGSVIIHEGKIIGEGYHQKYGEAHAEVNAINSVKDKSLLIDSTIYVNLEPCAHFGKTPPCADLIIQHKIPRVVIANIDPFKEVNGGGIARLRKNGVDVLTKVLAKEGEELNKRFFTFHSKKRPYTILKWAQTKDGFISRNTNDPNFADNWITSQLSKQLVHTWRAEETGILVGKNTVVTDNPSLTCREVKGKSPVRIVIDQNLELKKDFNVFNQEAKTIVFNGKKNASEGNIEFHQVDFSSKSIENILSKLYELEIQSLIVEGGAFTLNQFIDSNSWDEARVFTGNKEFGKGLSSPKINLVLIKTEEIDSDILHIYQNNTK